MRRKDCRWFFALVATWFASGCQSVVGDAAALEGSRPADWNEASQGERAPDYERLFNDRVVHRLDIAMSAEVRAQMLEDLTTLLGEPGAPGAGGFGAPPAGQGGPPGAGQGGFGPPAEASEACVGKKADDACTAPSFGVGGMAVDGACRALGSQLLCLPADFAVGGPPGGGETQGRPNLDFTSRDPIYVPVTLKYDGRSWSHVGLRYKGNSSLAAAWRSGVRKFGFRLAFDEYEDEHPETKNQRFFGFKEMTFSSAWNDPSLMRDKLSSDLMLDLGLPAARAAFYSVYVDAGEGPEYWGLYTMLEDPSDVLPAAQFVDGSGNVYKPEGEGADFTRFVATGFEKKTNEKAADFSDVIRVIDALHAPREDAARWREALEAAFDVSGFLQTLAISCAIGHWDSYGAMPHNYYLYGDPSQGGRLVWISWDHNLTWQSPGGGEGPFSRNQSVMMDEVGETWPLIRYLLDDAVYRAEYATALGQVLQSAYAKEQFEARSAELHALIAPQVLGEGGGTAEQAPHTHLGGPDEFRNALTDPARGLWPAAEAQREAIRQTLGSAP